MAFTKIAAAGIGSTGTVTLEHVVVTGSVETPAITGAASTANVRANSLVVSGVSTLGSVVATTGTFSGNVSIAGTLTYEDVTNIDSVGLITARSGVVVNTGTATTALIVNGSARITGILTIGTSSVTLDGTNNQVNVGTGVTIHHTNGVQVGGNTVHSTGLTVNQVNAIGIITASSFRGDGSQLTGIAATTNVRTDSLVVSGVTTATGGINVGGSFIKSNQIGLGSTTTTGRDVGIGTATGTIIFNNTKSSIEAYGNNGWFNVKNVGISSSIVVLTSSQTFIVPDGIYKIKVTITGAGGGGYAGTYNRGGGAGGTAIKYIDVTPGQGIGVTIGAGGAANSNTTGGTSYFGSYCYATGGYGAGSDGDYADNSSRGGIGVNGDINAQGGSAQTHDGGIVAGSKGGDSFWGGGARGKSNGRYYGEGAGNYGGGGGGGTYTAGGGSNGVCVIEWVL